MYIGGSRVWFADQIFAGDYSFESGNADPQSSLSSQVTAQSLDPALPADQKIRILFSDRDEQYSTTFHTVAGDMIFRNRPELHTFSRDPRELYLRLTKLVPINGWPAEIASGTLEGYDKPPYGIPADLVYPYGRNTTQVAWDSHGQVFPAWDSFMHHENGLFLPNGLWKGPGAAPDGWGSIKAFRVVTLPQCSRSVPFGQIFSQQLIPQVQLAANAGCVHVEQYPFRLDLGSSIEDLSIVSYLNHTDPRNYDAPPREASVGLHEGFLAAATVKLFAIDANSITKNFLDLRPCEAQVIYDYEFTLVNGFVGVIPHRIKFVTIPIDSNLCKGIGFGSIPGGLSGALQNALDVKIPKIILTQARDAQGIPPFVANQPLPADFNAPRWDCQFDPLNPDGAVVNEECHQAMDALQLAANAGSSALKILPVPSGIQTTIRDRNNWRCRPPSSSDMQTQCGAGGTPHGKCQFMMPGIALHGEPDEVRLQWFTDFNEYAKPPVVAFFAAMAPVAVGQPSQVNALCSPAGTTPADGQTYNRYFASTTNPSSSCVPQPAPQAAPPPPVPCGCSADTDCPKGDVCSAGQCRYTCVSYVDCPGDAPYCYTDLHVCGLGACNPKLPAHPQCRPWENQCASLTQTAGVCAR